MPVVMSMVVPSRSVMMLELRSMVVPLSVLTELTASCAHRILRGLQVGLRLIELRLLLFLDAQHGHARVDVVEAGHLALRRGGEQIGEGRAEAGGGPAR